MTPSYHLITFTSSPNLVMPLCDQSHCSPLAAGNHWFVFSRRVCLSRISYQWTHAACTLCVWLLLPGRITLRLILLLYINSWSPFAVRWISLNKYVTFYLSIHLLMNIWVIFIFWLFWRKMLSSSLASLWTYVSFVLDNYRMLIHMAGVGLIY